MKTKNRINIKSIRTTNQLKKLGSVQEIISHVDLLISPFTIPEDISTYEALLPFVNKANKVVDIDITYEDEKSMFATHRSSVLYCLTSKPIDSTMARLEFLNFPDKYHNEPNKYKKDIKRWFNNLKMMIQSQVRTDTLTHKASLKVDQIRDELESLLDIEIRYTDDKTTQISITLDEANHIDDSTKDGS